MRAETQLVFPYRGVYVRHLGATRPWPKPTRCCSSTPAGLPGQPSGAGRRRQPRRWSSTKPLLRELAPRALLRDGATLAFRQQRLRIDPRAQALVALLRHSLREGIAEPLEAESLALTLVQRALGPRTTHAAGASVGRQQLVDRAKLVLASDLARRWTLAEIAAEVGGSPVYLTQVFQQVEGLPLYRYQLRLRLARALDLLGRVRRPHRARPGPRLLQPQPFQRRVPRGLRPLALGVPGSRALPALQPCRPSTVVRSHRSRSLKILTAAVSCRDGLLCHRPASGAHGEAS